jgi:predicted transposase YdaD
MKESVTYQAIVEEGEIKGRIEGTLGRRQLGEPSSDAERALRGIADSDRLARLHYAILDVSSWDELLATP